MQDKHNVTTECGAAQPVATQMLHESGKRERSRVDRGRGGVLQTTAPARCARAAAAYARGVREPPGHCDLYTFYS